MTSTKKIEGNLGSSDLDTSSSPASNNFFGSPKYANGLFSFADQNYLIRNMEEEPSIGYIPPLRKCSRFLEVKLGSHASHKTGFREAFAILLLQDHELGFHNRDNLHAKFPLDEVNHLVKEPVSLKVACTSIKYKLSPQRSPTCVTPPLSPTMKGTISSPENSPNSTDLSSDGSEDSAAAHKFAYSGLAAIMTLFSANKTKKSRSQCSEKEKQSKKPFVQYPLTPNKKENICIEKEPLPSGGNVIFPISLASTSKETTIRSVHNKYFEEKHIRNLKDKRENNNNSNDFMTNVNIKLENGPDSFSMAPCTPNSSQHTTSQNEEVERLAHLYSSKMQSRNEHINNLCAPKLELVSENFIFPIPIKQEPLTPEKRTFGNSAATPPLPYDDCARKRIKLELYCDDVSLQNVVSKHFVKREKEDEIEEKAGETLIPFTIEILNVFNRKYEDDTVYISFLNLCKEFSINQIDYRDYPSAKVWEDNIKRLCVFKIRQNVGHQTVLSEIDDEIHVKDYMYMLKQ